MAAGRLRPSRHQRHHHRSRPAPPPSARRSAASRCRPSTAPARCGSTGGQAADRGAALRRDAVGADHRRGHRRRVGRACSSASPTSPSRSTTRTASPIPSTCATPCWCPAHHRIRLSRNGIWGRSCSAGRAAPQSPNGTRCAASMALSPEEPVNLSRTLTVPTPTAVTPTVWVRARQGPNLADLVSAARHGPRARRRRPDRRAGFGVRRRRRRSGHRVDRAAERRAAQDAAHPHAEAARPHVRSPDCGSHRVPQCCLHIRRWWPSTSATARRCAGWPATAEHRQCSLRPRVTDTVKLSLLSWDDVIDRTALGFDQLKPPGLAEVSALDARGAPIAAADAATQPCARHRSAVRDAVRSSASRDSSSRPRSPPPSARCSTASP